MSIVTRTLARLNKPQALDSHSRPFPKITFNIIWSSIQVAFIYSFFHHLITSYQVFILIDLLLSGNMMSESPTNSQDMCSLAGDGSHEIMLFGVRLKVDPMRKSVSMNDLSQYVQVQPVTHDSFSNSNNLDGSVAVTGDSGYASADDVARNSSNGGRERKRG